MKNSLKLLAIVALAAFFGLIGCSDQDPVSTAAAPPVPAADQTQLDDQAAREMLESLVDLVVPREPQLEEDQSRYAAVEAALAEYGMTFESGSKAQQPLPGVLQMAGFAASAMAAVNNQTTWPNMTIFRDYSGGGNAGFSVAWLEPHPDNAPNHYYCNVYVDRPAVWPSGTVLVTPYAQPINDAAQRQAQALWNPGTIYDNGYYTDQYVLFNYWYSYTSTIGNRTGQMLKFNLAL